MPAGHRNPVVAELNGSPTDNNATLFANGYNSVLDPQYSAGNFKKGPNQSVPDWDNQKALTIFEQMLQQTNNKIDGVLAANDGLANSVISALNARKLGQVPGHRPGRDRQGIQHILAGRAVHDGLQGRQGGGRRGVAAGHRPGEGPEPTPNGTDRQQGHEDARRCC